MKKENMDKLGPQGKSLPEPRLPTSIRKKRALAKPRLPILARPNLPLLPLHPLHPLLPLQPLQCNASSCSFSLCAQRQRRGSYHDRPDVGNRCQATRGDEAAHVEPRDLHRGTSQPTGAALRRPADLVHDSGRRPGSTRNAARNDPPEFRLR